MRKAGQSGARKRSHDAASEGISARAEERFGDCGRLIFAELTE
jgi:hypothetical protein